MEYEAKKRVPSDTYMCNYYLVEKRGFHQPVSVMYIKYIYTNSLCRRTLSKACCSQCLYYCVVRLSHMLFLFLTAAVLHCYKMRTYVDMTA